MQRLSSILGILMIALSMSKSLSAQEQKNGLTWYTDINKAAEVSDREHKPIFAFFTGSDWCGWCHKLQQAVFDKQDFKDWAGKSVVLLELDFPRNKKLPDALAQQNASLQAAFKVQGYPTIWMFYLGKDNNGNNTNLNALGSLGYPQSAPGKEVAAFLDNANSIIKNGAK